MLVQASTVSFSTRSTKDVGGGGGAGEMRAPGSSGVAAKCGTMNDEVIGQRLVYLRILPIIIIVIIIYLFESV